MITINIMILEALGRIDLVILFFFLGAVASKIGSDLEIPPPISKFLTVLLLISIGVKGGHEVRVADNLSSFLPVLSIGLISCLIIPIVVFFLLIRRLGAGDAAGMAAAYGSVSAVTFIATQGYLSNAGVATGGHMVALMVLMEIPAIIVALLLYRQFNPETQNSSDSTLLQSHENERTPIYAIKSVVLLTGGFFIGFLLNESSWISMKPLVQDSFKGFLAVFLLDLGIKAQRRFDEALRQKTIALLIGVVFPLTVGSLTMFITAFFEIPIGDRVLLSALVGSASYIAAPAAISSVIPKANTGLFVAIPLALTFPINILFAIPIYLEVGLRFFPLS